MTNGVESRRSALKPAISTAGLEWSRFQPSGVWTIAGVRSRGVSEAQAR